jgi:hypothetical protein
VLPGENSEGIALVVRHEVGKYHRPIDFDPALGDKARRKFGGHSFKISLAKGTTPGDRFLNQRLEIRRIDEFEFKVRYACSPSRQGIGAHFKADASLFKTLGGIEDSDILYGFLETNCHTHLLS